MDTINGENKVVCLELGAYCNEDSYFLSYLFQLHRINFYYHRMTLLDLMSSKAFAYISVYFEYICDSVFKIIPCKLNTKTNIVSLFSNEGILELFDVIKFKESFSKLILDHNEILAYMKVYRNKIQHNSHLVDFYSIGGSNDAFMHKFVYGRDKIRNSRTVKSFLLVNFLKDLNKLFIEIIRSINNCEKMSEFITKYYIELYNIESYDNVIHFLDSLKVSQRLEKYINIDNYIVNN